MGEKGGKGGTGKKRGKARKEERQDEFIGFVGFIGFIEFVAFIGLLGLLGSLRLLGLLIGGIFLSLHFLPRQKTAGGTTSPNDVKNDYPSLSSLIENRKINLYNSYVSLKIICG